MIHRGGLLNKYISRYLVYYPSTLAKGEFVYPFFRQYRKFQYLNAEDVRKYRFHRLSKLLKHATLNSQYYQELACYDPSDAGNIDEFDKYFNNLPFIDKKQLIARRNDFKTYYSKWSSQKTTGGSTGEPVTILKNPSALARERAATWRCYEWAGVSIGDRQARFWGVPHSKTGRFKAKLVDFVANRERISAFNLTEESLNKYYKRLVFYKPRYLYGYVSVIEIFARYIKDNKLSPITSLASIITTSEVLTIAARKTIEESFGVKVFNEYGCGEVGSIAHECEYGSMHIVSDNLNLEIDGQGDSGEIVVTDYFNYATPLVRYRLGDYATIKHGGCECGRTLPILHGIHGRAYDMIRTRDGRSLHPESIMYVFEMIQERENSFNQFQAIQEDINNYVVNIVPTKNWSDDVKAQIIDGLKSNISGDINTKIKLVDNIPREKSGKMRVIKSMIKSNDDQ